MLVYACISGDSLVVNHTAYGLVKLNRKNYLYFYHLVPKATDEKNKVVYAYKKKPSNNERKGSKRSRDNIGLGALKRLESL